MNTRHRDDFRLAEEAAEWVVRRMDDRSTECSGELLQWLKRSPQHIDEFLFALTTFTMLRENDAGQRLDVDAMIAMAQCAGNAARNVVPLKEKPLPPTSSRMPLNEGEQPLLAEQTIVPRLIPRWTRALTLAAAITVFAFGLWVLWPYVSGVQRYSTKIGEQRVVRLEDGSLLHLNTHSLVEADFSAQARRLRLLEGEALFTVAHDAARPFHVETRSAIVQAIGTQFNVYAYGDQTRVSVLEGRVRVAPRIPEASQPPLAVKMRDASARQPALLTAGEQAHVAPSGDVVKFSAPDVDAAVAWQKRRLIFHAAPLAEVAEEFNRYNESRIRISGDELSRRLIWGVFMADEPQALVKFLSRDPSLEIEQTSEGLVVRAR